MWKISEKMFKVKDVSVVLLFLSIFFWLITISSTRISNFTADAFFYAKELPMAYWIGTVFLLICTILETFVVPKRKHHSLFDISLIFIWALFLVGTPSFVYSLPRQGDTWSHMSRAMYIADTGRTNFEVDWVSFEYPGAFIFYAILLLISGVDALSIMKFYPVFAMSLISLCIYLLAKRIGNTADRKLLFAPIIFLGFNWIDEFHVSRQSFGFILYSLLMLILFVGFNSSNKKRSWSAVFIILTLALGISHSLTHAFLILNLLAICLVFRLFIYHKERITRTLSNPTIFLFVTTLLFIWLIFNARVEFNAVVASVKDVIQRSVSEPQIVLLKYSAQPQYRVVNNLRMGLALIEIGLSYFLFGVLWFKFKRKRVESLVLFTLLNSVFVTAFYSLLKSGWESLIERQIVFGLFFFSLMSSLFLSRKFLKNGILKTISILLVCTCVIACLLIPVTKYSVDPYEYYPSSFLSKESFILNHIYKDMPEIKMIEEMPEYINSKTALDEKQMPLLINPTLNSNYLRRYDILSFGLTGYNMFEIYNQRGTSYLANEMQIMDTYNRIFDLEESRIYVRSYPAQNE